MFINHDISRDSSTESLTAVLEGVSEAVRDDRDFLVDYSSADDKQAANNNVDELEKQSSTKFDAPIQSPVESPIRAYTPLQNTSKSKKTPPTPSENDNNRSLMKSFKKKPSSLEKLEAKKKKQTKKLN
jgi:hypothetical protein